MRTFISATYKDLVMHRQKARDALMRLGNEVGTMEVFGARPEEPTEACLAEVRAADIFVGLYAYRYGCVPAGCGRSITEMELDHAMEMSKPCFCFLIDEDYPWPPKLIEDEPGKAQLRALKARVRETLIYDTFGSPEDLAFKVATAVGRFLTRKHSPPQNQYVPLLAASGDLPGMLARAVDEFTSVAQTDYNQILLITTSAYSRQLIVVADASAPQKQKYRVATFSGLLGSSCSSGRVINAGNVREHPNYFQAVLVTASELVVPILSSGTVVGVLNSESEEVDHFGLSVQQEVEALAAAIGVMLPQFGWHPGASEDQAPWIHRPALE